MTQHLLGLPSLLASHLVLVLVSLAAAILVGVPLAIAVASRPRLAFPIVTIAGVIQTIPGLALLALMVPVLAETGGLGIGVSPFGFPPAVIALTLYAVLPILRNTITGLRGVDAAVLEAARGMGMSRGQILLQVELPLAAPVIAAGVRMATVWTVGAATLATPVGQACLGNYIFAGLQTRTWSMLLVGVAAAAALAVALDAILAATERALWARGRRRAWIPAVAMGALAGLVIFVLPRAVAVPQNREPAAVAAPRAGDSSVTKLRLGAKTFTEQYILVEVLRARLAQVGIAVEVVSSLGSTVVFDALRLGDIDAYVDYSGTIWVNHMHRSPGLPRWQILAEVEAWLAREHQIRSLGSLGFENAYALAMRREAAARLQVSAIGDLSRHARSLAMGGDYEWFGRGEWAAVNSAYALRFERTRTFDPTLLYDAVARGEVDVISAFSTDGRIAANDLITLTDPANALPPYDAMILLAPRVADDRRVACALAPLREAITLERMRQANLMVDRAEDKASPAEAARWLLAGLPSARCDP
ncbi:MAG: ABC transporter permease/substrate-binding protein [Archangium sp.]|nr:ABC transporter permease/substrate-binding protein [Archangium sp.]MDP3569847.1 ABC transporter permease/substrate-binding protein [Archangium sp.]